MSIFYKFSADSSKNSFLDPILPVAQNSWIDSGAALLKINKNKPSVKIKIQIVLMKKPYKTAYNLCLQCLNKHPPMPASKLTKAIESKTKKELLFSFFSSLFFKPSNSTKASVPSLNRIASKLIMIERNIKKPAKT